ncbi:hypothetical protein R1flu_016081 [Riccia fluitans]|uniref:Uncharacterized protein n=1 Tax=Riccia fluitans TaxID=41844 RepID=A0ABD1YL75_9MARC
MFCAKHHPPSLRIWWAVLFALSIWPLISAIIQFAANSPYDPTSLDDVLAIFIFPVTLLLLVLSIRGDTGLVVEEFSPEVIQPLVDPETIDSSNVTSYTRSNFFRRAVRFWMSSLLEKGSEQALQLDDIPHVVPEDRAETLFELFD